jgi:hypothetical protein
MTDRPIDGSLAWAVAQTLCLAKHRTRQRKPARHGQRAMGDVADGVHGECVDGGLLKIWVQQPFGCNRIEL